MEDVLLGIGSVVTINDDTDHEKYMIVGKRMINFGTMHSWDYYAVPYPTGLQENEQGEDIVGYYFNHYEIKEILFNSKDIDKYMIEENKIKESIDINK